MAGPRAMAILAGLLCTAACGVDAPRPAARSCPEGDPRLDCEPVALAGADDACWRLVECSALPVANPESDPSCCFDWASCVNHIESLPDEQFEQALACIEATSCDELRPGARGGMPRCLD